ncbi:hypothetical protein JTB14_014884 [Gonioctena quinquepunctata]|nr:hypothetical protein JTB14_014884 [Gonioctena quinquepunctata]
MKEIDSSADRASVRAKVNSLRTDYRRELKKMKATKKSGGGTDDVNLPTLWYFDEIDFLRDQETQMQGTSTMDETETIEVTDETDDRVVHGRNCIICHENVWLFDFTVWLIIRLRNMKFVTNESLIKFRIGEPPPPPSETLPLAPTINWSFTTAINTTLNEFL